jgi:2-hydroxy-3-keto-5-methylthiopentenyl-1-phosphate phosphatase
VIGDRDRTIPVGAVLVDFDGTACVHDVAEHLLLEFGDPSWPEWDAAWERGEIGARDCLLAQDAMLRADRDTMLAFVGRHCAMDPTFGPFVAWLRDLGVPVAVVSDGFGFYIEPLLAAAGLPPIPVITNEQRWDVTAHVAGVEFTSGHPECIGCGTCKMQAVLAHREQHGPVAFIGEGTSDRYGALYADVTFAKLDLVALCERDGVEYVPWENFDDVRRSLETMGRLPGPVAPLRCPGWALPDLEGSSTA